MKKIKKSNKFNFLIDYPDDLKFIIENHGLYNEQYERQALLACTHDESYQDKVMNASQYFRLYNRLHQKMFEVIRQLHLDGKEINYVTIPEKYAQLGFRESNRDDKEIASILMADDLRLSSLDNCLHSLKDSYYRRELLYNSNKVKQDIINGVDSGMIHARMKTFTDEFEMVNDQREASVKKLSDVVVSVSEQIDERDPTKNLSKVDMPYPKLSKLIIGFNGGDMVVIAARPGMGKTDFMIGLVLEAAKRRKVEGKKNNRCAVVSLEMRPDQMVERKIAQEGNISRGKLKTNSLNDREREVKSTVVEQLSDMDVDIFDNYDTDIFRLSVNIEARHKKEPYDFIAVDYLQLIGDDSTTEDYQRISNVSRRLKLLAIKLDVPLIVLSQLSREATKGTAVRKPDLTHLRGSGSIEQDADIVVFIHRPKYYDDEAEKDLVQDAYIIVAKQRAGALGEVIMSYHLESGKFVDADAAISIEELDAINAGLDDTDDLFEEDGPF